LVVLKTLAKKILVKLLECSNVSLVAYIREKQAKDAGELQRGLVRR
jgi:hypothetical protein